MRILGIDPALRVTGFGVIEVQGQRLHYIASGTIETGGTEIPVPQRLATLYAGIREVVELYKPNAASMEQVFLNVNPRSTLLLGQARGAAIASLVSDGLPMVEFSALEVKKAIVGTGRASKSQVQEMVKRLLKLNQDCWHRCLRCSCSRYLCRSSSRAQRTPSPISLISLRCRHDRKNSRHLDCQHPTQINH
jgi:crossover junction endodeoxyribonuclease RuvC